MAAVVDDDDDVAIAAITVAELRVGVLLARGRRQAARQAFLEDVRDAIPVLDYDVKVALTHAELLVETRRGGVPRGAHDLVIAATARASERIVVTADAKAFEGLLGVDIRYHRGATE